MITIRHVVATLAVLSFSAVSVQARNVLPLTALLGQAQVQQSAEDAAVQALQMEYNAALVEYQKPLREAKTREEAMAIKLDPAKHPAHTYYPRFKELAEKFGKTRAAFAAWTLARTTAQTIGNAKAADDALNVMIRDFINSYDLASYVTRLAVFTPGDTPERMQVQTEEVLARIDRETTNPEVRAAVLARRAGFVANDAGKVMEFNREIVAKYPNTAAGKRAKSAIFEAENLSVGKMAPDFEAEDIDGKKFKLSDYRGKVVVMEFWGFW